MTKATSEQLVIILPNDPIVPRFHLTIQIVINYRRPVYMVNVALKICSSFCVFTLGTEGLSSTGPVLPGVMFTNMILNMVNVIPQAASLGCQFESVDLEYIFSLRIRCHSRANNIKG